MMFLKAGKKWSFGLYTGKPVLKVLPSVTWKEKNESNKFMDLEREFTVRMMKAWLLIAYRI